MLLQSLQKETGQKYFHTGNLDPMARGLMLFIPVKLRFLEKKLKKLPKIYKFSIIQGFTTDSNDLLGLIINYDVSSKEINFKKLLPDLAKDYVSQSPPKISRKNLTKSKLSNFLQNSDLSSLPCKPVKIYDVEYLGQNCIYKERLYNYINNSFKLLPSDFRQNQIFNLYKTLKNKLPTSFIIYNFKIKVSGGFYVRSLVRDFSIELKTPLTTFGINRVQIGVIKSNK